MIHNWEDLKLEVMAEILTAKLEQHPQIRELLRNTGTRTIIENSPTDTFWGI
jgi:N-glycosidase YbiA